MTLQTTTITGLPNASAPLTGAERVPIDQSGETRDASTQDIANLAGAAITSAVEAHTAAADPHTQYAQTADDVGLGTDDSPTFAGLTITGTGPVVIPHIHGAIAGNVYLHVKNTSGNTLAAGTCVRVTGSVGSTDRLEVAACDPTDSAKMPAVGVLETSLANQADGDAIIAGELRPFNTGSFTLGRQLYVGAAGALTDSAPTSGVVQAVGSVARVDASTGTIAIGIGSQWPGLVTPTVPGLMPAAANPGGDRILFWDHSAEVYAYATIGPGVVMDGTTLRAESNPWLALGDEVTTATSGLRLTVDHWPFAQRLTAVPLWTAAAPAGSAMQMDIRVGGTSIFSTLPTIAVGDTSSTATTPAVFSSAFVSAGQTIAAGSAVTFHVTQAPSGGGGSRLKVLMPAVRV